MNKQLKRPQSKKGAERLFDVDQRRFGILNQDDPASQIRDNDLTNIKNAHSYPL